MVEGYLLDPDNPTSFGITTPPIYEQGDNLISQRLTQLINTYWINSIAPYSIPGNFTLPSPDSSSSFGYNTDTALGSVQIQTEVITCHYTWLTVLLVSSRILLLCGIAGTILDMLCRGPDILNHFTALRRDNPYVQDLQHSSMENAGDQLQRLRNARVRLGDVHPEMDDAGYVAIGLISDDQMVHN